MGKVYVGVAVEKSEGAGGLLDADKVNGLHASEIGGGGGLPSGIIVMWSGLKANIPSGWVLCDGANGTPDLKNKFIYGVGDGEEAGGTGGAETHVHSNHPALAHSGCAVADHPAHTHQVTAAGTISSIAASGAAAVKVGTSAANAEPTGHTHPAPTFTGTPVTSGNPSATLTHSVTQPSDHAAQAHASADHKPPYFKLCFIMKV